MKGRYLACASEPVTVDGVPNEIKILPLGMVHSQKGDFQVDDESVEMIRSHFKERKLDLVIDYEHQTLQDIQAPAGGWIKDIYKGEDALIAKVEWTQKAAEYLKNKEYRYLSPVVLVRKKDRKASFLVWSCEKRCVSFSSISSNISICSRTSPSSAARNIRASLLGVSPFDG